MFRPKPDAFRRWVLPVILLALAPKCLACVAAWLGVAALLGFAPEICGGP
jgi:hypothetical protein